MTIGAAGDTVGREDALSELERILKSRVFAQSTRLRRFLRFTVEHALAGKADLLKEYLIGCEVYDRRPPYDPTVDSIVRTEACRLRGKLGRYYDSEGRCNPLRLTFDLGTYVPSFVRRSPGPELVGAPRAAESGVIDGAKHMLVGVAPFRDLAQTGLSASFTKGLSQEIAQILMRRGMYSVMEGNLEPTKTSALSGEPVLPRPDFRLEGSIREAEGGLSVMVRLIRAEPMPAA